MGEIGAVFASFATEERGTKEGQSKEGGEYKDYYKRETDRKTIKRTGNPVEGGESVENSEKTISEERFLLERFIRNNDKTAFVDIVKRYEESINRMLYVLFKGRKEDMEDAKQEILIALYERLKDFRFESSFHTFLYRVVKNRAIDFIRKMGRERRKIIKMERLWLYTESPSPEDGYVREEEEREIMDIVFALKESERMILLLKDYEGFSVREISKIFNLPEGTIKSKLHRARKRVVKLFNNRNGRQR